MHRKIFLDAREVLAKIVKKKANIFKQTVVLINEETNQ